MGLKTGQSAHSRREAVFDSFEIVREQVSTVSVTADSNQLDSAILGSKLLYQSPHIGGRGLSCNIQAQCKKCRPQLCYRTQSELPFSALFLTE